MRRARSTLVLFLLLVVLLAPACGEQPSSAAAKSTDDAARPGTRMETTQAPASAPSVTLVPSDGAEPVRVRVEIADNDAERQRGLMERTALAEDAGMLFVFGREKTRSFWMKDTLIPLSIAYIGADGRIVDIEDMEPLDETSHPSAEPAQYALEVNQGFFKERGIKAGDRAEGLPR